MEEHSAGGVIIKKINNLWHVLVLKDMNNNWTFPKGLIDPGENAQIAAIREIQEEAGVHNLTLLSPLQTISYWYVRNNQKIHKTVDYFLFEGFGEEQLTPQTAEGISEVQWMSIEKAKEMIGYPKTNLPLLEKTYDYTHTR